MLKHGKILRYLAAALFFFMLPWSGSALAANYQWIQSDWSGGETTGSTGHDPLQSGQTLWNRYSSKDVNVEATSTPGQISISPLSTSRTQTTDADFNAGALTGLVIVGGGDSAYLKIKDYPPLDTGTGADGDLVIDGTTPGNSMENGIPLGQAYPAANPFIIDTAKNYRNITVQNSGSISATGNAVFSPPANVRVTTLSGTNGPDGSFYYVVTAVDRWDFQTTRSPSADSASNLISVSGVNAPRITWDVVTGAIKYRVYRRSSTATGYGSPALVCTTATTECLDTKTTPDPGAPPINSVPQPTASYSSGGSLSAGTYYYALTAIDTWGLETTIGTQRSITVSNNSSVALSWTSVIGATGYRVYRTTVSGLYNSPAFICSTTSSIRTCTDTLAAPLSGAPPRSYGYAVDQGLLRLKATGTLFIDSTSNCSMTGKGFPGGDEYQAAYGAGLPGYGPGAAGNRGGGGGYGTGGSSNSNVNLPANIGYPYGDDLLTTSYPGSGGASGISSATPGFWGGKGGSGGGTIWISAGTVRVDGSVRADGNAGAPGVSSYTVSRSSGGGGGGSGGAVLIEGDSVVISGRVSAVGGDGGLSGTPVRDYTRGGAGGSGRIRISAGFLTAPGVISPAAMIGDRGTYESPSFDLGSGGVDFSTIDWVSTLPPASNLRFQIAANKDNQTWNFVGPGGLSGTYYPADEPSCGAQTCPIYSGHDSDRYVKFRVIFASTTIRPEDSPTLDRVTINYQFTSSLQSLTSSPYDSIDSANTVRRWSWLEDLSQSGTDVVLQMRTSANGTSWGSWYGPHSTTFSSSSGVTTITVADVTGFSMGSRVTLTSISNPAQTEAKKIIVIDAVNRRITLDSATSYAYAGGSIFTDTYTDPGGTEEINPVHRDGSSDRWVQYRLFLSTENGLNTPFFLENRIGYLPASGIYQPDGVVDGNGNNIYGAFGSGGGGTSTKPVDPGFILPQPLTYEVRVQNDGTPQSINDTYTITWNSPSDLSGNWSVLLNDGASDRTSPASVTLNAGAEKTYTMKVTPSAYAPADSIQDIILNLRAENEYARVDSIRATARVNRIFQSDGLIDNIGDNLYDPNRTGGGGTSSREAGPGDIVGFSVMLQNEGNIADTYTFSLLNPPPIGWIVYINDGSSDHDITNPSAGWTTPSIPPPPYSGSTATYTLKVIPKGTPATADMILNVYSNGGAGYLDSLTARLNLRAAYKADGIIYGYAYDGGGEIRDYGVTGAGCGTAGPGDNIYGASGSGSGGCTARDIAAGTSREFTVAIQNEGNVPDSYRMSWNIPAGWGIVMQEMLNDGSSVEYGTPVNVPTVTAGNPDAYNGGEMPFFTFKITPPSAFTSGSQTITFDIRSAGDNTKVDSVRAVINSGDTTPPSPVVLNTGSITATSVRVSWTAPGDDGGSGTAASYDLRYSTTPITEANFSQATKIIRCKTGESTLGRPRSSGNAESCTVSQLFANTDYYFALKSSDELGNRSLTSTCSNCPAHTLTSGDTTRPANITDLAVTDVSKDAVTLCWSATADDGATLSSGAATGYELRYSKRSIVDDGVTPGAGQVAFSSATLATPAGGFSFPGSPGSRECYIVPVENKIDTGGGVIDDRTHNTRFYFAIKALDEARNKSLISNIVAGLTSLVPYAYNMVSVPYVPSPNTPTDVFGDDVGAQLYAYWWDSRGPNFDSGCYDGEPGPYSSNPSYTCTRLTSINEGLGYFLWAPPGSILLDVPSGSTQTPAQSCVDDRGITFQCYAFPLQEGWNMTGPPFDKEINFTSVDVNGNGSIESAERGLYVRRTSGTRVDIATFQDAVTARNWIDGSIYTYNGINYTYEVCDQDKAGEPQGTQCSLVMQPWKAYWMRMHVIGGATFELLIPN